MDAQLRIRGRKRSSAVFGLAMGSQAQHLQTRLMLTNIYWCRTAHFHPGGALTKCEWRGT